MATASPEPLKGNSTRLHLALSAAVELLPVAGAVLGGLIGGVAGTILLDWALGLVCAIGGAGAGLLVGVVTQFLCSVLFIWGMAAQDAIVARNYVPLVCGVAAAIYTVVRILRDGGGNDVGLLAFGTITTFTLGAGIGGVAQGFMRWIMRHFRARNRTPSRDNAGDANDDAIEERRDAR